MSESILKGHRRNLLNQVRTHIQYVSTKAEKYSSRGLTSITDTDIKDLCDLSDKCANHVKSYVVLRQSLTEDQMLRHVDNEFSRITNPLLEYTGFHNEKMWLGNFGSMFEDACDSFIATQVHINPSIVMTRELYNGAIDFKRNISIDSLNMVRIRAEFQDYLDEISKIVSGTGLVC
jgi:hypothetical protein